MKRRLFTLAAGLSAVLWLAVAVLWPWSYWDAPTLSAEHVFRNDGPVSSLGIGLGASRGGVGLDISTWYRPESYLRRMGFVASTFQNQFNFIHGPNPSYMQWGVGGDGLDEGRQYLGFQLQTAHSAGNYKYNTHALHLVTPAWFLLLLLAITPAVGARRAWLARRRAIGLCSQCGYDLRGSPAGGPCPECGTARAVISA